MSVRADHDAASARADLYVVMGVAGSGKSSVGGALARGLGVIFVDGDDFHPPQNIERMSAGIPLTDEHRAEWLRALAARLGAATRAREGLVLACSALRRAYRDVLRAAAAPAGVRFVYLHGERELIAGRLALRPDHFMPATLLQSQLELLEEPTDDEDAWTCDIRSSPEQIVASLMARARA